MPIRVIGYFPTVRVTNDETVKIRKVGYQGPAGRPASDFNFSELANVADSAAPTLGNIPCGDGTLWQSVALTPALAGADPTGSAAAAQAVAIAAAATRSDNASNLSTGTVPLGRLAGITNAQLSATAGILSSQIAGLDASKITGTFPLSLLNQGTTGQFLRGDGTYSNTLTGGLTIAGALAGATTGAFSGAVATGALTVTGALSASSTATATNFIVSATAGLIRKSVDNDVLNLCGGTALTIATGSLLQLFGNSHATSPGIARHYLGDAVGAQHEFYDRGGALRVSINAAGINLVTSLLAIRGPAGNTGTIRFCSGSGGDYQTGATVVGSGVSAASEPGYLYLMPGQVAGARINLYDSGPNVQAFINTSGVTLSTAFKIIYGAAGTTTASNNEITGVSTGINANVASGGFFQVLVAGSAKMSISSGSISLARPLVLASGSVPATATSTGTAGQIAWDASGNIYICSAANTWRRVATATF